MKAKATSGVRAAAALLFVFCGSAQGAQTDAAPAAARIPLHYDAQLAGADFTGPAARLTFNGKTAWFLVDTGTGIHVLGDWFVKSAGLTLDEGANQGVRSVDDTGNRVALRAVRNPVAALEDGGTVSLGLALVVDFPPEFEQFQIGGVISPQLLAGDGRAAAFDLRTPELRLEPFDAAVHRLGAVTLPRERVRFCGSLDGPVPGRAFAIPVSAGGREGLVTVDSGAKITRFAPASVLIRGVRLRQGGETTSAAGARQLYAIAPDVRLQFGGRATTLDARVSDADGQGCGHDGLLGLDLLRECAVVLGQRDIAVACGVPLAPDPADAYIALTDITSKTRH